MPTLYLERDWDHSARRWIWRVGAERGGAVPILTSRMVVLVHGYNTDPAEAREAYAQLCAELTRLAPQVLENVWELFWPGYLARWNDPLARRSVFSQATYPYHVRRTAEIGRGLADFIRESMKSGNLVEITLIAHSLGCRVVLEALKHFTPADAHRFPAICLMAAAVPQEQLRDQLNRLSQAAIVPRKRVVLFSHGDRVLRRYFPGGQTAAHDGFFPEAVGLFGAPAYYWQRADAVTENTGLDHGDYFSGAPALSVNSRNRTAPVIARLLNQVVPTSLMERRLPEASLCPSAEPASQYVAEHRLTARRLG